MYNNLLGEISYVEKTYEEYLSLVNYYANFNRQSIFCRYFNIDIANSTYVKGDEASFDRYNSGVRYNVYDYTPLFYLAAITNDIADQQDLIGQMFQGTSNIIVYTIETPRVEDIVVFPYAPLTGKEIFRVSNVRAAINAKSANPAVNWYELTIEYAPLANVKKLNVLNEYTYNLSAQKYMLQGEFISMVTYLDLMESHFKALQSSFDHEYELYTIVLSDGTILAPLSINKVILDFLSSTGSNESLHSSTLRPFGVKKYCCDSYDDTSLCVFIGVKNGCNVDESLFVNGKCNEDCSFEGNLLYPGGLVNYEYPWRDVVELEYDTSLRQYIEVVNGKQTDYRTLNYLFNINIYDLAILINTWKYYVENDNFPVEEDAAYGNAMYLHSDQHRLVYRIRRPYEIHQMTSSSDYVEGDGGGTS